MKMTLILPAMIFYIGHAQASLCAPTHYDERVTLEYINDGDTITLTDGRLVRLIGIDSPEIDYQFPERSQAYAMQARDYLKQQLSPGQGLKLVFDNRKLDPFGRTLAYVYTEQGKHLQEMLLAHGFAKTRVYNNDYFWLCLNDIERKARALKVGLWGHQDYLPRQVSELTRRDLNQWREVRGVVTGYERKGQYFERFIDEKLSVVIAQADISKFSNILSLNLLETAVVVRGSLYYSYKKWRLNGTHPSQISLENTR